MDEQMLKPNPRPLHARRGESGQAIVLMALVMVVLLGMLGLAIDGGGLYFLWRDAQNANDAAVLAATYARCTGGDIQKVGLDAAERNGFNNNGTGNKVAIYNPPIAGDGVGNSNYVQVDITANKRAYFIQLVYRGPLEVTTRAVGFCIPPFDPTTVPAVFAGSTTCSNAIQWTNSTTYIEGGLFSNKDLLLSGGGGGNVVVGGSGAVTTVEYKPQNTTWYIGNPPQATTPSNNQPVREDPLNYQLADYAPSGSASDRAKLYTGVFSQADDPDFKSNGTWDPANGRALEGLYYINGNVTIGNNVVINGDRNGDGKVEGTTIVASGTISINAGPGMSMRPYMDYLMVFSGAQAKNCGDQVVDVSGSKADWRGLIYAPDGGVKVNLSELYMRGAIIGSTINMGGSDFTLIYDPNELPPRPPSIQVAE